MSYRVWTINMNGTVTCMTDWQSRTQCQRFIIARWGHWPPWAHISKCKDADSFVLRHRTV